MKGAPATYLGRIVEKKNFRAFIYDAEGKKRLVESWDEFQACMETGVWFASLDHIKDLKPAEEEKASKPKEKDKTKQVEGHLKTKLPSLNTSTCFEVKSNHKGD